MNKNHVELIGEVTDGPQVTELAPGRSVSRMTVRVKDHYRDRHGEWTTETNDHEVFGWGKVADQVRRMIHPGSCISLEGRLIESKRPDAKNSHEVVMSDFTVLSEQKGS